MEEMIKYVILGWFLGMVTNVVTMLAMVWFMGQYLKEFYADKGGE